MRACGPLALRIACALHVALALLAPRPGAAAAQVEAQAAPQVVLLLPARALIERSLSPFIEIQPGRYLATRELQRACTTPTLRADHLLLFLPASLHCEQVAAQQRGLLRGRLQQLTGRWLVEDPQSRLRDQPYVALAPAPPPMVGDKTNCTCPNRAPTGAVICDSQTRIVSTPIQTIEYLASDEDEDALSGTFSYQRDADPVQPGLPAPLNSSCTPAAGTLQCTVNGNAPAQTGVFQLNLLVSDGQASVQLTGLLGVAAFTNQIFVNGFEDAVQAREDSACPAPP